MDRKTIRAILADETLDESAKVSRLLQMHHDEVADIKSGLKTDEDVKAAVAEALKTVGIINSVFTVLIAVTVSIAARTVGALIVSSMMVVPVNFRKHITHFF